MTAFRRLPFLALGGLALMTGLGAGLGRLGWPAPAADLAALHGPLMVAGFFGTVIGIERAVASGNPLAWGTPLACGAGTMLILAGQPSGAAWTMALASTLFLAQMAFVLWRHREAHILILGLAAAAWCAGTLSWALGGEVRDSVTAWAAFLALTIFGERLELSRFGRPLPGKRAWAIAVALATVAAVPTGWAAFGIAVLAAVAWLWRFDVARFTVRQRGLTRYVAVCLLSGYAWLALAGALMMTPYMGRDAFVTDAALHALFLGFVFSMVFGHAPVILPAILRVALPYRPSFYIALIGLHATLVLRIGADLAGSVELRAWAGAGNAALLVGWIMFTALSVRRFDRTQGQA